MITASARPCHALLATGGSLPVSPIHFSSNLPARTKRTACSIFVGCRYRPVAKTPDLNVIIIKENKGCYDKYNLDNKEKITYK
jgi:hypothetical protein